MVEFLVEAYCPSHEPQVLPDSQEIAEAADRLTREGQRVALVRTVFIPEDETCFYLFEAGTGEAVREAAARSCLRFDRVVEAVSAWTSPGVGRVGILGDDQLPRAGEAQRVQGGSPLRDDPAHASRRCP